LNFTLLYFAEPGFGDAVEVPWDPAEIVSKVYAGHGTSFILSKYGNLFSFGQDKFGVLGILLV
jgi:hypothetical protein